MSEPSRIPGAPRWVPFALLLGLYLTAFGYRSREGDQAYRLPLLLHRQDPGLYADDPFVRAFDAFNPHRGYLALLDASSRLVGLSTALAGLYALTFALACTGLDRLARSTWPGAGPRAGVVAVGLVLLARAGNIGTNHLFEPILLDRGIAFALGWVALGLAVDRPDRGRTAAIAIGLATLIHPSVGLQLAMLMGAAWVGWASGPSATGVAPAVAGRAVLLLGLAMLPGLWLHAGQGRLLFRGLPADEFRLLSAYVQSPQHMLPHLWRKPQWLAWGCYPALAILALARCSPGRWPAARVRLAILLGLNLIGLGLAWAAVEVIQDLRVTVFQPFRMATVFRGLALVALADRVLELWRRGDREGRARGMLLVIGLTGDWSLVVATLVELAMTAVQAGIPAPEGSGIGALHAPYKAADALRCGVGLAVLGTGLVFLARHDTESGQVRLLAGLGALTILEVVLSAWKRRNPSGASFRCLTQVHRRAWGLASIAAWAVPMAALAAPWLPGRETPTGRRVVEAFAGRCRFGEVPVGDLERLADWCRAHTPESARFIGPPGPKTFRLWSRRSLAFNRAGSPYHAEGLADWAARFRDHVDFHGSTAAFGRAYLADRQALERRYRAMSDADRAALARRQGATHVLAAAPSPRAAATDDEGPLELLRVEGRYAVYRVRPGGEVPESPTEDGTTGTPVIARGRERAAPRAIMD